jgi:diguanylate cyclase (GGDEF)-like protein
MNQLEQQLLASPSLPTLPDTAQQILALPERNPIGVEGLEGLAEVIGRDPGLTAKLLGLINSPIHSLSQEVGSLREAMLYLGTDAVRSIALSFCMLSALRDGEPCGDGTWQTSLMNALAARRLAIEVGGWDPDEAFLCGLIADCGVLLLAREVDGYGDLLRRFQDGQADLLELERGALETDHMRLGGLLLEHWNFPEHLCQVIAAHHDASQLPFGSREELHARVLNAAWLCARALSVPGFTVETQSLDTHVALLIGLPVTLTHAVVAELPDELNEAARLFDVPADRQPSFDEMIEQANALLQERARSGELETTDLDTDPRIESETVRCELSDSLGIDPQTGLVSRASLEQLIDAHHARARRSQGAVSVMIIEIDGLKAVREKLGLDAALDIVREIAARAEATLRGTDRTARFAEDQIAALLPGCGEENLHQAAERVRARIEAEPVETGVGPFHAQVAIGLAVSIPHQDGLDSRSLIMHASSALDRAQASPERIAGR